MCGDTSQGEDIAHLLISCTAYTDIRSKKLLEFEHLCSLTSPTIYFSNILEDKTELCQFLLDPTSLNLKQRVSTTHPQVVDFFKISRHLCHMINTERLKILDRKNAATAK